MLEDFQKTSRKTAVPDERIVRLCFSALGRISLRFRVQLIRSNEGGDRCFERPRSGVRTEAPDDAARAGGFGIPNNAIATNQFTIQMQVFHY
jgi:hypothetical protein